MSAIDDVINAMTGIVQEISQYPESDVQDHPILVHIARALQASVEMLKKAQPSTTTIPGEPVDPSTQEQAAAGVDRIPEVKGDETMSGLSQAAKLVALAKKYPDVAEVLNMAKDHPILAKLITTPKQKEKEAKQEKS
jgi:2-oxo-4-hydroxy-4-carboxy--5-ureidoimidazoline (OHCU) decarboxylase